MFAAEPDPDLRAAFRTALSVEHLQVRERVTLRGGSVGDLTAVTGGTFDAVLLLGV